MDTVCIEMEKRGYTWKMNRRKYIALQSTGDGAVDPSAVIGKKDMEGMRLGSRSYVQKDPAGIPELFCKISQEKLTGLQALYYSYLYRMGVLKKRPKRIPYTVRADIRKLDERIRQIEFLQKEDITTRDQLSAYRKPFAGTGDGAFKKNEGKLYRSEPESKRLGEITMQLKELRGKIELTVQIEKHSLEIEELVTSCGRTGETDGGIAEKTPGRKGKNLKGRRGCVCRKLLIMRSMNRRQRGPQGAEQFSDYDMGSATKSYRQSVDHYGGGC